MLDIDLETATKRLNLRNKVSNEKDSFESEKLEYHNKTKIAKYAYFEEQ